MFQEKVLKILWTQDDPKTICNRLEVETPADQSSEDVRAIDDWTVELAAELVKKLSGKAQ